MVLSLTNKIAVVTGASRGIGFAVAKAFAHAGVTVYLVSRNAETIEKARNKIYKSFDNENENQGKRQNYKNSNGTSNSSSSSSSSSSTLSTTTTTPTISEKPQLIACPGDVRDNETWETILKSMRDAGHEPDILVNAAGIAQSSLLYKTSPAEIDSLLNVNLRGTILACTTVGRAMCHRRREIKKTGQVNIINVSSLMATHGQVGASIYAASKAGVLGLGSALSKEYGAFGVRVNTILPGYIDTDMIKNQMGADLISRIPLRRLGQASEVADAARFLACNPYVNGSQLVIDGGLSGNI